MDLLIFQLKILHRSQPDILINIIPAQQEVCKWGGRAYAVAKNVIYIYGGWKQIQSNVDL